MDEPLGQDSQDRVQKDLDDQESPKGRRGDVKPLLIHRVIEVDESRAHVQQPFRHEEPGQVEEGEDVVYAREEQREGMALTLSSGTQYLFTKMAAPPARARKEPAMKTDDILDPLKKEAAKMVELVMAQPEKICQKMGMAALDSRKMMYQYTASLVSFPSHSIGVLLGIGETYKHHSRSNTADREDQT